MAEKVTPIKIRIDEGDSLRTLEKLQANFDSTKKQLQALNRAEKKGVISAKQANKQRAALTVQHKANRKALTGHTNAILKQNNALQKNSGFVAGVKKGVGQWASSVIGITAALGVATRVIGDAVKTIRDFDQAQANLSSVLGVSRKEIALLTEDAKRLGASTAFTAGEVANLQTEFAKLGFSQGEILNMTEATLSLAAATGTELNEAAAVAGATLGGFGLEATETGRVVNVMAKSFSVSALDMEKFKESMKTAAPAARAVGLNIEQTTALLGTMAKAGVSGSKAGNNLKTSLINLNKAGLTLEQGLEKVANSQDKLGTATQLVGKNAAASFLILAEGRKTTDEIQTSLENAGNAAQEMAEKQLDTLQGSLTKLSSAWDGFILSLEDGDSVLGEIAKDVINLFTSLISGITEFFQFDFERPVQAFESWVNALTGVDLAIDSVGQKLDNLDNAFRKQNLSLDQLREKGADIIKTYLDAGASADTARKRFKNLLDIAVANGNPTDPQGLAGAMEATASSTDKVGKAAKKSGEQVQTLADKIAAIKEQQRQREAEEAADQAADDDIDFSLGANDAPMSEEQVQKIIGQKETIAQTRMELNDAYTENVLSNAEKQKAQEELLAFKQQQRQKNQLTFLNELQSATNTTFSAINDIVANRYQAEIEAADGNKEKQEKLAEELFKKQKKIATAQAVINGAIAFTKTLAELGGVGALTPAGAAVLAGITLSTAAQVAVIQSQQFAKGGIIEGESHDNGGVPIMGGRAEVEGGEAIINKRSTALFTPLLSAINEAGGGRPFAKGGLLPKYQEGGILGEFRPAGGGFGSSRVARNQELIVEAVRKLDNRIDNIKVTNVATETADVNSDVKQAENVATFG